MANSVHASTTARVWKPIARALLTLSGAKKCAMRPSLELEQTGRVAVKDFFLQLARQIPFLERGDAYLERAARIGAAEEQAVGHEKLRGLDVFLRNRRIDAVGVQV